MPQTNNAKKALRKSAKLRLKNRSQKAEIRTAIKRVRALLRENNVAGAKEAFRIAQKKLDQAGDKSLYHPNKSSRLKSRLSAAIKKVEHQAAGKSAPAETAN